MLPFWNRFIILIYYRVQTPIVYTYHFTQNTCPWEFENGSIYAYYYIQMSRIISELLLEVQFGENTERIGYRRTT